MSLENLSEVQSEKLFWKKVAEDIKETDFRRIYQEIFSDIESGNYVLARQVINEEIKKIIADKNMAMFINLGQRGLATIVLKEEFYKLFPEIESLIEQTEEERRAKIKVPAGQVGEDETEEDQSARSLEEWRTELGNPYLVEERKWEIPKGEELVPGLEIIFRDEETKFSFKVEFLDFPRPNKDENNELQVKARVDAEEADIFLADMGLKVYSDLGLWNSRFIPTHWEVKQKK